MGGKTSWILTSALAVCLVFSLSFVIYDYLSPTGNQPAHHSTFFSFVFDPKSQNLTSGNQYLNLTFDIIEGNLTVKVEVNTEGYNSNAFLALQFDSDNNGTIDVPYVPEADFYFYTFGRNDLQFLLRVNNYTTPSLSDWWGWLPGDRIYFGRGALPNSLPYQIKSPFHYCLYNGGVYTFFFTFPAKPTVCATATWPYSWLFEGGTIGLPPIQGTLVRVLYGIEPPLNSAYPEKGATVYVPPFNFME